MRIFGWAADESSGCWWYRIKLPLDALRAQGHEVEYSARLPPEWWFKPDVVIGQRLATPEATERWQRLADQPGRPLMVYETDDDLLDIDPSNVRAYQYFGREDIRENVKRCVQAADLVTVTTGQLADTLRPLNPNVHVLPNYLPRQVLDLPQVPAPTPGGPTVIGWAGSQTHADDFTEVADALCRFVDRNRDVHYNMFGLLLNGKPALFASLERLIAHEGRVQLGGWFPLPYYYEPLAWHIGIAPLKPTVFNQSKSPVKALEFAARGIATIASDTGPYADYIRHGVTGLLARTPRDWYRHLRDLTREPDMRRELVANARANARTYLIEDHVHEWVDTFRSYLCPATC